LYHDVIHAMKILICAAGSHGDVFPMIAIGREMFVRGHDVVIFSTPYFRDDVITAGLRFAPVGTVDDYYRILGELAALDSIKSIQYVARLYTDISRDYHRAMRTEIVTGQTIAIGGSIMFAHRLLQETDGVACATVHLAPAIFRSNLQPPRLLPIWITACTPKPIKQMTWWISDRIFYEPFFTKPLNQLRGELGLAPVTRIFRSWIHQADCVLAMFPEWFAPWQADWPADVVQTGFPLYDTVAQASLPEPLAAFIAAGAPPVAFSAGTANAYAQSFFTASVAACRLTGTRGILLSHIAGQVTEPLPEYVMHVPYAPFSALLPKLGAFVHHGGIGATSQALRAGVPQLIRPVAYDQFDNAAHAMRLGVARELLPRQYSPRAAADALAFLTTNEQVRQRCTVIAARFTNDNALQIPCDAILSRCAGNICVTP
jgi:UDP:flavonoid glycosyltransferase YjiC (YdhE family)